MLVTITQFAEVAVDANGNTLPMGARRLACTTRTADGAFAALDTRCRFIRVATDTKIQMDIAGGATTSADELLIADTVEYFAVVGGEVLTIATVA